LKNCFPKLSEEELKTIAKAFYKQFCRSFLETLKFLSISKGDLEKRYQLKNKQLIEDSLKNGTDVILYGSHFGNWEWMSFLPSQIEGEMFSFYRKVSSPYFNDFMIFNRQRFGNICVESRKGPRKVIQNVKNGKAAVYYLIGDQSPNKASSFEWFDFFNRETAFLMGAPKLAKRFEMDSFFIQIKSEKAFQYEVEFVPFPKNLSQEEMAQFYVRQLEAQIQS